MQTINICFARSRTYGVTKRSVLKVMIHVGKFATQLNYTALESLFFFCILTGKQAKYTLND